MAEIEKYPYKIAKKIRITCPMQFNAAEALASLAGKREVVPDFMNPLVHRKRSPRQYGR